MLHNYLSPYCVKKDICSIQNFNSQSHNQSLLLSNNVREKKAIRQENDQYLVKLKDLIDTQNFEDKINELSMIEETTILKDSTREKEVGYLQNNKEQSKNQIARLKGIIKNKNKIIGQLTQQTKILTQFINKILLKNKKKKSQMKQDKQLNSKDKSQRCNSDEMCTLKQQIYFLNNNNRQLFQQITNLKQLSSSQYHQISKITNLNSQMQNKINLLTTQNQNYKKQNQSLLKKVHQYLKNDKKQIKIVNKIREVLNQKVHHKQINSEYFTTKKIYQQMKSSQNYAHIKQSRIASSKILDSPILKSKSAQKVKNQEKKYNKLRYLSQQLKKL